jgi:hypothetical protein
MFDNLDNTEIAVLLALGVFFVFVFGIMAYLILSWLLKKPLSKVGQPGHATLTALPDGLLESAASHWSSFDLTRPGVDPTRVHETGVGPDTGHRVGDVFEAIFAPGNAANNYRILYHRQLLPEGPRLTANGRVTRLTDGFGDHHPGIEVEYTVAGTTFTRKLFVETKAEMNDFQVGAEIELTVDAECPGRAIFSQEASA